ncbi:response regulator [Paenibacillus humicola]|uniref:response regulator n=1 Tax=Paenibacillus humicola TaxID=3110540 RepID=UPI00237C2E75|nr:response regulator [Paenibacillus humicola]
MKLIIIEDEPKVRKALRSILAALDEPIEIAGEAENALEGLRLIEESEPDLMLLDLAIPGMHGLELIAHMQTNRHECQVVIISGHDSFAFAQQALRYNVVDYILKPFDKKDLSRALDKAIQRMHSAAFLNEAEYAAIRHKREETSKARARIIRKIYNGEKLTVNEQARYPFYLNTECWSAHLVVVRNYFSDLQEKYNGDLELVEYVLCNFFEEILQSSSIPYIFGPAGNNCRLVFWLLTPCNALSKNKLCEIAGVMKKMVKIDCMILREGSILTKNEFSVAIHQLEHRLLHIDLSQFEPDPAVIDVGQAISSPLTDEKLSELSRLLHNIQLFIDYGMHEQAAAALQERFACWLNNKLLTCQFVYLLFSSLVHSDSDALHEEDPLTLCLKAQLNACFLLDRLLARLKNIGENSDCAKRPATRKERAAAVQTYIELNYSEALSLTGLAQTFFVSKEYLASSFKDETGATIHQYIQNIRLQKATELLREQEYRISDVAQRVGYDNYSYFDKLFRKKYGHTPSEYRSKILNLC